MLCCWFAVGLMKEELVEEGRACIFVFGEKKAELRERVLVKEKVQHHEREGKASGLGFRKVLLLFF